MQKARVHVMSPPFSLPARAAFCRNLQVDRNASKLVEDCFEERSLVEA